MNNPSASLFNKLVSDTYQRIVQYYSGSYYDGLGNELNINSTGSIILNENIEYYDITQSIFEPIITLQFEPLLNKEQIYKNGIKLRNGTTHDYIVSGSDVLFKSNHQFFDGDVIEFRYFY